MEWNDAIQMKVGKKKCFCHKFLVHKTLANKQLYKNGSRKAEKPLLPKWPILTPREIYMDMWEADIN